MLNNPATRAAGDDAIRPFQVDALDTRGRAIQMGPALNAILSGHNYPEPVSRLLGEAIVLTVLLGSSLKFDGQFILQAQGDGPVSLLVVDYRTAGHLRAYAGFKANAVAEAMAGGSTVDGLLGKGLLGLTIDQGPHTSRYQGIVALDGGSLEDAAHSYFAQSEQIPTRVRLAAAEMVVRSPGGLVRSWRAGGLIAQFLPAAPERMRGPDLPGGDAPEGVEQGAGIAEDDAWVEARSLVSTIEDHELLDPEIPVDRLLYRLFHERGVRVFEPREVESRCSCSRDRIETMLRQFSAEEIAASVEDGKITVTCEFCGTRYAFDPAEFLPSVDGAPDAGPVERESRDLDQE